MKKTYIAPALLIVHVTTGCQICIGSPNKTTPTQGLPGDPLEDGGDDPGEFSRRRRNSVWDEEDEEEDF